MKPFKVYIGWDKRDIPAYEVCVASLLKHASVPVEVVPIKEWELRLKNLYWRDFYTDPGGQFWDMKDGKPFSTDFSFTRFCVPQMAEGEEVVLFMDADMMFRGDIAELIELADPGYGVQCVKREYLPPEEIKMIGLRQEQYRRKNWSSVMLMRPPLCKGLTPYNVNNQTGEWLHSMRWIDDELVGELPEEWNWLEGEYDKPETPPAVVHFTNGGPWFENWQDVDYADLWRSYL